MWKEQKQSARNEEDWRPEEEDGRRDGHPAWVAVRTFPSFLLGLHRLRLS